MSVDTTERPQRVPPQNLQAEQAVIGSAMLSKEALNDALERLTPADFYTPPHTIIFDTVVTMADGDQVVDQLTVMDALTRSGTLERVGGASYLIDLVQAVPIVENVGHYADIVAELAQKRRVIEAGARISQIGWNAEYTGVESLDRAGQVLFEAGGRDSGVEVTAIRDLFQTTLDEIEANADPNRVGGLATGFADLDRIFNGLKPGQLILVAARPGMGKSVMMLNILAHNAIKHGVPSALFSLEMSTTEIMLRLLSAYARIPLHILNSGQLSDDDWAKLSRCIGEIEKAPLFLDYDPGLTMPIAKAKSRRLARKNGVRLFAFDYLQIMNSTGRPESRELEISSYGRGFKRLAGEVNATVIAGAQLNRGPEQRSDKRPQLSDLRESGSLEQDADIVIFPHRDDYYDKEGPRAGEADFIVAKHRNGATDTVAVAAQLHLARFVDMAI